MKDVGPSTPAFFQGGDAGLELERREVDDPVSFRFFDGGPSVVSVAASSSLTSARIESQFAGPTNAWDADDSEGAGPNSGVTRSSCCEMPFGLPFCMSCNH